MTSKVGIIILSRIGSSRVPNKTFRKLNGVPLIEHLIARCLKTGLPVFLAVPLADQEHFEYLGVKFPVTLFYGFDSDPLARMSACVENHGLDHGVRVCHDKIFVDAGLIHLAIEVYQKKNLDYLYSSKFTQGSLFEIISKGALKLASDKYKDIEYIGYAARSVTANVLDFTPPTEYQSQSRFLIDYPEDITLMEVILSQLGNACTLVDAIHFMEDYPWLRKINDLPSLSVYTCAKNAEKFIEKCMGSIVEQSGFHQMEYLLVDDFSQDKTPLLMAKLASTYSNIRLIRNSENLGIASASNVALGEAKGQYIMRLDADDYLTGGKETLNDLIREIKETGKDVIYPNNYHGSLKEMQNGKQEHHIGGAIFKRSAINHVKFTELLKGLDGLDVFTRAKGQINIGYYGKPVFFYRQHKGSLTKNNLDEREKLKAKILAQAKDVSGLLGH